jgi:RNA polymerase sigma-70 factor (ECF subfamily)
MSVTDAELVGRARAGDRAAFDELVRRTSRLVYARLYLETGDAHRTEDLLQETFLLAYRSLNQLARPGDFRLWLSTIAQRALIDAGRRDSRLKRTPPAASEMPLASLPSAGPAPEVEAGRRELQRQVLAVLRSLPEEFRVPLTLRYLTGAGAEEIGAQLGLTNGSLRGLLYRGLKMLRDRLPPGLGAELDE